MDVFSEKPRAFSAEDARLLDQLAVPFTLFLHRHLKPKGRQDPTRMQDASNFPFIGSSAPFTQVCRLARDVAPTVTPVLITGETGSGKEVMAATITL